VQPFHVAAFVKELQGQFAPPTVKRHLAALRMLFDWLVTGHVIAVNPAHAVCGPKYVVTRGKTPVLTAEEARSLLDSIDPNALTGLRDRALIGVMVYTFARVNAVIRMKVKDYFTQGRRGWVRLHEKGGKEHAVPCHHTLEKLLDDYIAAAGIARESDGPLFRTTGRKTGLAQALWQQDAYRMIQRRAVAAGIRTRIGNHTFRATGITAYLKNKGLLEHAQTIANLTRRRRCTRDDAAHGAGQYAVVQRKRIAQCLTDGRDGRRVARDRRRRRDAVPRMGGRLEARALRVVLRNRGH
jgi:integrase/recombinase XerD